jgi:hypothetical protein
VNRKATLAMFAGIFILSTLVSCKVETMPSSTVPQNKLLRYYHAMSTNEATTYVKAFFYTEAGFDTMNNPFGKAVELDEPSIITFNDAPMEFSKGFWTGVYYGSKFEEWPKNFKFVWTDNRGRKHVNTATMDTIRLKKDWLVQVGGKYAVVWEGSPVRRGEVVAVSIDPDKDSNLNFSTNVVGARMVVLSDLPIGFNTLGYHRVEITRTFSARLGATNKFPDNEDGVYIRLIYSVEE